MAITISNLTVSNNAPAGTTIGVLVTTDSSGAVIPCNYMLTKGSIGYFAIAGNNLVTAWTVPATPGHYSVRIRAIGSNTIFSGSATFTVDVGIAVPPPPPPPPPSPPPPPPPSPPPPPPPSIQINGSTGPVTVSAGATISATVTNGPGNLGDWLGVYAVGAPTGTSNPPSWKWLSTDGAAGSIPPAPGVTGGTVHLVVPAQAGQYEVQFFLNNSFTLGATSAPITVATGAAPPPPPPPPPSPPPPLPPSIQINGSTGPVTVSAGATISATVTNGPGNPGDWLGVYAVGAPTGTSNPPSWKWLSTDGAAGSIPPAPGVTGGTVHLVVPAQAGQYEVRFFLNNSFTIGATSAPITVATGAAPPPPPAPAAVITVTPNTPRVPDTTSVGAVVATYTVTMSDGSPFVGTLGFGAPNFDAGGIFALTGSPTSGNIIVNPKGPGIGPNLGTITDHITLIATQP